MKALIYQPVKTPTQSVDTRDAWILEFTPETPLFVENLMGWVGSPDTIRQIRLGFPTREAAEAYARREGIAYALVLPKQRRMLRKAYADNFRYNQVN